MNLEFKIQNLKWHPLIWLVLPLLVLLVYGRTLTFDFIYDDFQTIVDNPHVHTLADPLSFFTDPLTTTPHTHLAREIYRPLRALSFAVDHALYGLNPAGFHFTNILWHLVTCGLLVLFLRKLKLGPGATAFAAVLFSIHPALVENVSYISARADILTAAALLGVMLCELRNKNTRRASPKGVVLFFLACLAKETSVMFPVFFTGWLWLRKRPLRPVIAYTLAALTYVALRTTVVGALAQTGYYQGSFWLTQAMMAKVWLRYLAGIFWPSDLTILPAVYPETTWVNGASLAGLATLLALGAWAWHIRRQNLIVAAGWLWWFVFLLPVANLIPIKAFMAWRFTYLPWLGVAFMAGSAWQTTAKHRILRFISILWLLCLAIHAYQGTARFRNTTVLWQTVLKRHPTLVKPYLALGQAAKLTGDFQQAESIYRQGLAAVPGDAYLVVNLAEALLLSGQEIQATEQLQALPPEHMDQLNQETVLVACRLAHALEMPSWILARFKPRRIQQTSTACLLYVARAALLERQDPLALRLYRHLLERKDLNPSQQLETRQVITFLTQTASKS